jgi:UDP:flavonoid glycosyltransferase YjiC (YdhE family)
LSNPPASRLPCVVLFNINGTGMGHLSTCLAYANRMRGRARPVFFSLASAIESIHDMGFEADYMVSRFSSRASAWAWDQQLALRLGLFFEHVRPDIVVFDGNWPYRGLLHAARVYGVRRMVWSNLVLYKPGTRKVPVREDNFDLIVRLGEIGSGFSVASDAVRPREIIIPPLTILKDDELLDRDAARAALGLKIDGKYALFSLGPGNLKKVDDIGRRLIAEMTSQGYTVIWARAAISQSDLSLPEGSIGMSIFPIARYLRGFDALVCAAGYNTCCEVLQAGVPTLFVPNRLVADDQARRARLVAESAPAVVSDCESSDEAARAVAELVTISTSPRKHRTLPNLSGAELAADEILALVPAGRDV